MLNRFTPAANKSGQRRRNWALSLVLAFVATLSVIAGLWLRFAAPISPNLRDASGGITYVLFFIFAAGAVWPRTSSAAISISVLAMTCGLEFLQLSHPAWLEACRRTIPGRLLLGTTFEATDFPPYFVGAALGWAVSRILRKT